MTPYTITLTLADADALWVTAMAVEPFANSPEQEGRFEPYAELAFGETDPATSYGQLLDRADAMVRDRKYADGVMMWCDRPIDAIVLRNVLRAAGYHADVLADLAGDPADGNPEFVVISSRPYPAVGDPRGDAR